jgi:hypothetical protein
VTGRVWGVVAVVVSLLVAGGAVAVALLGPPWSGDGAPDRCVQARAVVDEFEDEVGLGSLPAEEMLERHGTRVQTVMTVIARNESCFEPEVAAQAEVILDLMSRR